MIYLMILLLCRRALAWSSRRFAPTTFDVIVGACMVTLW